MNPKQVFIREATGLVRELTALDAYILAVSVVSLGGAAAFIFIILGMYPGSNFPLAFTIGLIPAGAFILVYSILTSAFPRSGGDYVWVSRIAGPVIGFTSSWLLQFSYLFFINGLQAWYVAWVGVPSTLTAMGIILKAPYLTEWSAAITSSTNLTFLISFVALIVGALICFLGVRSYSRIMRAMWLYGMLGMAVWIGLLLVSTNAGFVSSFNSMMSGTASYEGIIKAAADEGLIKSVTIQSTLVSALVLSWSVYAGFYYSVYMAGETKNVNKSIPIGLVAGLLTAWGFLVVIFSLSANVFGYDFMYAMSALSVAGSPAYTLPFGPSIGFLMSVLTDNPILVFIASSSLVLWWFIILPPLYMAGSRVIFGWAWDRLVPSKLADVNETMHSPILALSLCVVVNAFWAYMSAYQGYYLTFINLTLVQAVGWAIPGFAAAVFPYVKRDMYERTVGVLPRPFSSKIAGVPVLTIGGLVQGISMLLYGYSILSPTLAFVELSPAVLLSFEWLIVAVVTGVAYILVVRAYRKSQGLDLRYVFEEIPPE